MFRKSNTIPQRNKSGLTKEQMIEDIEAVCYTEEHRNKLYFCIDEKPPREHRFEKIEEFLKGSQDLQKGSNILTGLKNEMQKLQQTVEEKVSLLKQSAGNAL